MSEEEKLREELELVRYALHNAYSILYEKNEEIEKLHSIINEVREYILSNQNTELSVDSYFKYKDLVEFNDILQILDKEN